MACVMLHNLCIDQKGLCKPQWKLRVDQVDLAKRKLDRYESKDKSRKVADKIAEFFTRSVGSVFNQ